MFSGWVSCSQAYALNSSLQGENGNMLNMQYEKQGQLHTKPHATMVVLEAQDRGCEPEKMTYTLAIMSAAAWHVPCISS